MNVNFNSFISNTLKPLINNLIKNHPKKTVVLAASAIGIFATSIYYIGKRYFRAKQATTTTAEHQAVTSLFQRTIGRLLRRSPQPTTPQP